MRFKDKQAIYKQIAEYAYKQILNGKWPDDERIPSIRDMAVEMEVNPNTMTRTYMLLQDQKIIYNRRGIGYFTAADASKRALIQKRQEFIHTVLPDIFKTMTSLKLSITEFEAFYRAYMDKNKETLYEDE